MKNQVPDKRVCLILDLLFGTEFQKFLRKPEIWILSNKMKHYLNDLSNPNLWNVGRFDYALAIIKNIFLFIKQIFLNPFFLFPTSLWLKDHDESKVIHLFCVILAILFFISDIAININIFLFVVNFSSFFSKSGYLIFCD